MTISIIVLIDVASILLQNNINNFSHVDILQTTLTDSNWLKSLVHRNVLLLCLCHQVHNNCLLLFFCPGITYSYKFIVCLHPTTQCIFSFILGVPLIEKTFCHIIWSLLLLTMTWNWQVETVVILKAHCQFHYGWLNMGVSCGVYSK